MLEHVPSHVTINAASKFRTVKEVEVAIKCGIKNIGFNYIQEGIQIIQALPQSGAKFHLIGHLQSNKTKLAVRHFDSIDTVHCFDIAKEIDNQAGRMGKKMEVMIQVKDHKEAHKNGIFLDELNKIITSLAELKHIEIKGLLAMGPSFDDHPEELRAFFKRCCESFENLKTMKQSNLYPMTLSLGMSDSYLIAIEEGANQIRLGTAIYGNRPKIFKK